MTKTKRGASTLQVTILRAELTMGECHLTVLLMSMGGGSQKTLEGAPCARAVLFL